MLDQDRPPLPEPPPPEPFALFAAWYAEAGKTEPSDPNASLQRGTKWADRV